MITLPTSSKQQYWSTERARLIVRNYTWKSLAKLVKCGLANPTPANKSTMSQVKWFLSQCHRPKESSCPYTFHLLSVMPLQALLLLWVSFSGLLGFVTPKEDSIFRLSLAYWHSLKLSPWPGAFSTTSCSTTTTILKGSNSCHKFTYFLLPSSFTSYWTSPTW